MKAWEQIINTLMLGTDKPAMKLEFPEDMLPVLELIDADEGDDKESKFLKKAAVAFNYRQCGFVPLQKQDIPAKSALVETKDYCSRQAAEILNSILDEDNIALLEHWLIQCNNRQQLIFPEVLPVILDKAHQQPFIQPMVVSCSGNRGSWLSSFNKDWDFFNPAQDEEIWKNGKPADRLKLLEKVRQNDPAKAVEMLQQTWEQENAAGKLDLLKVLKLNSGPADLPWLESLTAEKGQKVKDEALALLKQIPGSRIVKQYEALLEQAVVLKKEKALFGMMNKTSIMLQLPDKIDDGIFKSGIEKLSGPKSNFSDSDFIIYQLIGFVPPVFWEKQFGAKPAQVVEYFEKYSPFNLGALGMAVSRFKETGWIPYFLEQPDKYYIDFLDLLSNKEQEKYLLKLKNEMGDAIHHSLRLDNEWGPEFTLAAINHMANNPYQYNKHFYSQNIKHIPIGLLKQLDKVEPGDAANQSSWNKIKPHLTKLLTLKQQTIQAFNS